MQLREKKATCIMSTEKAMSAKQEWLEADEERKEDKLND